MNDPMQAGGRVRMRIDGDELSLVVEDEGREVQAGSLASARKLLQHEPPTAAELETVIEVIEDRIMPALRSLPAATVLEAAAGDLGELAHALPGLGDGGTIGIDAIESLFNRLADVASGSPLAASGLPADACFALRLVLLRELMHHGGFRRMVLLP